MEELYQQLEWINERLTMINAQIRAHSRSQPIHQNVRPTYRIKKEKLEVKDHMKKERKEMYRTYPTSWKLEGRIRETHFQQIRQLTPAILNAYADPDEFVEKLHVTECEAPVQRWAWEEVLESLLETLNIGIEVEKDDPKGLEWYLEKAEEDPAGLNNEPIKMDHQRPADIEHAVEESKPDFYQEFEDTEDEKKVNNDGVNDNDNTIFDYNGTKIKKDGIEVEKDKRKALRHSPKCRLCVFDPGGEAPVV
ncbi:14648_t:CDS:2 [Cetraspora pellucida]|uniref:14648_t:CDS:1 n=1 Tax=Cetraspora pellucida TaxID=1433469 RepID=A0A9N8WCS8_9GLOM|nr:14648_t:CDS:2 [Cetraspora pellucida]